MEEIWKDVPGYEGLYQVSTYGRVRSLDRIDTENHFRKGQIMSLKYLRGYARVGLRNGKRQKYYFVHRLVALAFIPNPNNYPLINHKDQNPGNNMVDNLEWCDCKYNLNYGTRNELLSKALKGRRNTWQMKPVVCYSKTGELVGRYDSAADAGKAVNVARTNITAVCKKKAKTAGGYRWEYA